MTIQPVETEQQFLGNVPREQIAEAARFGTPLPPAPPQHYAPNAHRLPYSTPLQDRAKQDIRDAIAERALRPSIGQAVVEGSLPKEPDLWFDAETQTNRALVEIQDGNINAGIACLQAALAFAQNYRHSLTEETAR